ncbi:MAG: hypothetical protein KF760_25820 [Candidatus Eremiobacteraeota bacterium]|nr:hypothetical protein [Candidatus Eremiobacteraeota bacterium]MCW5869093.1 hypothetical protein [Candidatus Eremiobacteraeota bacterium]
MKRFLLLGALLVCGCGSKNGFAAFVVNQDAQAAGSKPGKSYNAEPCSFVIEKSVFFSVISGEKGQPSNLNLRVMFPRGSVSPSEFLGKTLEGSHGQVQLEGKEYELEKITVTVQTLQDGVARGNFNARIKGQNPPWEVVGSFDAKVKS